METCLLVAKARLNYLVNLNLSSRKERKVWEIAREGFIGVG